MKPRNRSLTGAVIAVLVLPVFAGLLACMPSFPVPIGNPEKSRIDSDISGMWISSDGSQTMIHLYVPYDKRTWLLTAGFAAAPPIAIAIGRTAVLIFIQDTSKTKRPHKGAVLTYPTHR